jgi:hypothetical protein
MTRRRRHRLRRIVHLDGLKSVTGSFIFCRTRIRITASPSRPSGAAVITGDKPIVAIGDVVTTWFPATRTAATTPSRVTNALERTVNLGGAGKRSAPLWYWKAGW